MSISYSSSSLQIPNLAIPSSRHKLLMHSPSPDQNKTCERRPLIEHRRSHQHQQRLCFSGFAPRSFHCLCRSQTQQEYEVERLFSNLNQVTLKREPGSLSSAIFLVAGTTVGAGILAIPAVTQESGFLASAVVCVICWVFMVATGLLIAEVNVNTMCELGSGGVSLVIIWCRRENCYLSTIYLIVLFFNGSIPLPWMSLMFG
uniref:Tyrosine-specific transport protein isoform X2 n=1 Tax=Rhizophora mucronata TaxID=61149 RepID=A0A2P2M7U9_RHIMU